MGQYYAVLRSVVRDKPQLRRCLRRCRHCGIFFLTHPRNAGRRDLGCPFGCRAAHRQQASTARSVAYYRSPEGKQKKRMHNGHRQDPRRVDPPPHSDDRPCPGEREEMQFDAGTVRYVGMVVSLIEGRRVSAEEIVEMLVRAVRQHSMDRRRKMAYVLSYGNGKAQDP